MLNSNGFDVWADGYDESVRLADESDAYPFAGYATILKKIYGRVCASGAKTVLDIGFGTGTLAGQLYQQGCDVFGQDFSSRMIQLAQGKMPRAQLYQGDFSLRLVQALKQQRYDAIIATYALHHLTDEQKAAFLQELLPLLQDNGCIYVGDVAFATRAQLEQCKAQAGDDWDASEIYFVYDELKQAFPQLRFEPVSHCAGLLTLKK
ncbi:MAG TPA: class I SAM-dependent methyltransferase [Candidatus Egerieenecus merdigallinarum]|nr:class I SAM-dependent methyltransferase [Candidatus Egerieenecus merdigallinarum]